MDNTQISGTVFDIKKFSIHDGPGIRTTVFLKGCPLSCVWCHNPEGISPSPEIHHWDNRCIACGDCAAVCPQNAITFVDGKRRWETQLCVQCGACAVVCPAEAVQRIGDRMTVSDVLSEIEKDALYYDQSGGGVTFSGGEPLNQIRFLIALLQACKAVGIHTAVDTCGFAAAESIRKIIPVTDLFLYDLKFIDTEKHQRYTGVSNDQILDNLRQLAASAQEIIVRIPVIPGINDDPGNISDTGAFLASLENIQRVDLLPYHNIASDKYARKQSVYSTRDIEPPPDAHLASIAEELGRYGLSVTVGG
jgi:pyruvate formate lyase activating enzyme